jgi:site-specific DNA-adenine methylase|tara:strand:- start:735 stop:1559 length:825 start_codon:yes stop_codon:yes gene_type:complete
MTTYQGGKQRIGKKIYEVIKLIEYDIYDCEKEYDSDTTDNTYISLPVYFEPFVGMGGVLRHFCNDNRNTKACDINKDLIILWKELQKGWKPPKTCSEKKYNELRDSKHNSAERAFCGIVASWGGNFFNNYRLKYQGKKDYMGEGYRSLMKIKPSIINTKFLQSKEYWKHNPKNITVYCDPPYKGNNLDQSGNGYFQDFDHDFFWDVMRKWSTNNIVVISESTAPKDFKKIWSKECKLSTGGKKGVIKKFEDNLYIHKSIYDDLSKNTIKDLKLM